MLLLAQGNALGEGNALMKVSRSVRAIFFMRGIAPRHCVRAYALGARGIFAVAQKCRMYQSRRTFPQGVALGSGQQLGLQPAPISVAPHGLGAYFIRPPRKIISQPCFLVENIAVYSTNEYYL